MCRHHNWAPNISGLKLLSGRHRIFVSFLEHTGSILENSEHLFMSSQSRGYLTVQSGFDTRWLIFCMLLFFFGKTKLLLGILMNFLVEDWVCMLPWKYCTVELRCFSKLFFRGKIILWLLNAFTKCKNKCTSLFFRNTLFNFIPFKDIYGKYLRNLYFYYNT